MIIPFTVTWSDVLYDEKFIIACISLLGGLVTYFGYVTKRAIARLQLKADATHEQVANTHSTNFRDDLDKNTAITQELWHIAKEIQAEIKSHGHRLDTIEGEMGRQNRRLDTIDNGMVEVKADAHEAHSKIQDTINTLGASVRNCQSERFVRISNKKRK